MGCWTCCLQATMTTRSPCTSIPCAPGAPMGPIVVGISPALPAHQGASVIAVCSQCAHPAPPACTVLLWVPSTPPPAVGAPVAPGTPAHLAAPTPLQCPALLAPTPWCLLPPAPTAPLACMARCLPPGPLVARPPVDPAPTGRRLARRPLHAAATAPRGMLVQRGPRPPLRNSAPSDGTVSLARVCAPSALQAYMETVWA